MEQHLALIKLNLSVLPVEYADARSEESSETSIVFKKWSTT